jgi:hypothetical protein
MLVDKTSEDPIFDMNFEEVETSLKDMAENSCRNFDKVCDIVIHKEEIVKAMKNLTMGKFLVLTNV